jgi:hypothetical protein
METESPFVSIVSRTSWTNVCIVKWKECNVVSYRLLHYVTINHGQVASVSENRYDDVRYLKESGIL